MRYQLKTYGIAMDMFPISDDGGVLLDSHIEWITQRQKHESRETVASDERVIAPGPNDVLMGQQWEAQSHPGNIRLRSIIATHWETYDRAKKLEKTKIAQGIVQEVNASGSRFLRLDGAGYVLAEDTAARVKVSSSFRDRRKALLLKEIRKGTEVQNERRSFEEVTTSEPANNQGDDIVELKRLKWSFDWP
jgi:hypothetical protein